MHERSSLIHSQPPPRRPRNERRSLPFPSPSSNDLLDDAGPMKSPKGKIYNPNEEGDVDLLQMNDLDEVNVKAQSSLSTQVSKIVKPSGTASKLQQRIQGRKNLNFVGDIFHNDDDETDNEDESHLLDFKNLEMETIPVSTQQTVQLSVPLHDLTLSNNPSNQITKTTAMEFRQHTSNISDAFKYITGNHSESDEKPNVSPPNSDTFHITTKKDISQSTPKQKLSSNTVQNHAKQAVSTLFGSSVIFSSHDKNSNNDIDRYEMKVLHSNTTSLLDTISFQEDSNQLSSRHQQGTSPTNLGFFNQQRIHQRHAAITASDGNSFNDSKDRTSASKSAKAAKLWFGPTNTRTQTIPTASSANVSQNSNFIPTVSSANVSQNSYFMDFVPLPQSIDISPQSYFPPSNRREFLHERVFKGRSSAWAFGILNDINWLNLSLFVSYGLSTAASSVPITLLPTIALDVMQRSLSLQNIDIEEQGLEALASVFASKVTTYAVLGTALGKFINGPLGDILGARRVACCYALLVSTSLMALSFSRGEWSVIYCCAAVEYYQSVQWPCTAIILAAHYSSITSDVKIDISSEKGHVDQLMPEYVVGQYEKGIYIVSMGSRIGSLFSSIVVSILLRYHHDSWRFVARLASMGSFMGFLVYYFVISDSPGKLHDPQNPFKGSLIDMTKYNLNVRSYRSAPDGGVLQAFLETSNTFITLAYRIFRCNILPSMRNVLSNGTFWIVALAHSGGLMVCSSVRILGTYFRDTSNGSISGNLAGFINISLSIGVLIGLAVGGRLFSNLSNNARARKKMVSNLYIMAVAMCYSLAFLAIPFVRHILHSVTLVAMLQMMTSFFMGAGVAVQVYCIPAIVGCTFGVNKGIYAAYTDGVASIISSWVWNVVGGAVEEGNPQGYGWVYGWAGIALLVVLAGLLMVEFVEYYFCRGGWLGLMDSVKTRSDVVGSSSFSTDIPKPIVSAHDIIRRRFWHSDSSVQTRDSSRVNSLVTLMDANDDDDSSTVVFEDANLPVGLEDIENSSNLFQYHKVKDQIYEMLNSNGNDHCCDCNAPNPKWVLIILPNKVALNHRGASKPLSRPVGCFICGDCATSHQKLVGVRNFSRICNIDQDSFNNEDLEALLEGGNSNVNKIFEAYLRDTSSKPTPMAISSHRDLFIKTKYEKKMWYRLDTSGMEISLHSFEAKDKEVSIEMTSSLPNQNKGSVFEIRSPLKDQFLGGYERFGVNNTRQQLQSNSIIKDGDSFSSDDSDDWEMSITSNRDKSKGRLEDLMDL